MIAGALRYERPESLDEVLDLLAEHGSDAAVLAGGQDLVPQLSLGTASPGVIVDIGRLGGLTGLRALNGLLTLGARVSHREIERSDDVRGRCGLLSCAAAQIGGGPQVRNRGTIGGAVAAASPVYDYLPCLVALDATVHLASKERHRAVPVGELVLGAGQTAREPDELVTEISVAAAGGGQRYAYEKLKFSDGCYLIAGVACIADVDDAGVPRALRIAVGGATPAPLRLDEVEALCAGNELSDELLAEAAVGARRAVAEPITDALADGRYRRRVTGALVKRALAAVAGGGGDSA
ncbi:MAG: xanthine dehydrogenase family protein subunit M [Actinomycetia bacterium]|nr:xanthine dehydrogenase family protein subunit M [Actinomycetes bacterium]